MFQHFAGMAAALVIGLWSTVLAQYHEFRGVPYETNTIVQVPAAENPPSPPSVPSPFETLLTEILESASTTGTSTATATAPKPLPKGPVDTTRPSAPFRPLPIPVTPPITPPLSPTSPPSKPPPLPSPSSPTDRLTDEALL
ncbi:MAG: hypothetical protein WBK28_02605, partial [Minisyncoccia bacterium]